MNFFYKIIQIQNESNNNSIFFSGWLKTNNMSEEFEHLPEIELNKLLEVFYTEVKSKDGNDLAKSTFFNIRAGICRHMRNPPYQRNFIIMNSPEFASSNRMFVSLLKRLKESGKDESKHYAAISEADLDTLKSPFAFDQNDPDQLQEKVFFDLNFQLARRGRENLRNLEPTAFHISFDDVGREYCEIKYNEKTKNHPGCEMPQAKPRMYSNNEPTCPVASLKKYLSKLDPSSNIFYVQPIKRKNFKPEYENIWYTSKPHGINRIGNMMKKISERLHLSQTYTNHCIRATTVTELAKKGFEARQIMRVTGHKCESSLRSYDRDNSTLQKRLISESLAKHSKRQKTPGTASATVGSHETEAEATFTDPLGPSTSTETTMTMTVVNDLNDTEHEDIENPTHLNSSSVLQKHFTISNNTGCTFNFHF